MLKEFKNNPYFRFTFFAILLYVLWYVLYEAWIHPSGLWDKYIINSLVDIANWMLRAFGFTTFDASPGDPIRTAGIDGTTGVWIGDPCNGFSLFALFLIFMIAYPGPWKQKLWYIPLGLVLIHLVNAMRVAALAYILKVNWHYLEFNHNYTFTIIVYGFVFILWWIWATKFASPWLRKKDQIKKNVQ